MTHAIIALAKDPGATREQAFAEGLTAEQKGDAALSIRRPPYRGSQEQRALIAYIETTAYPWAARTYGAPAGNSTA